MTDIDERVGKIHTLRLPLTLNALLQPSILQRKGFLRSCVLRCALTLERWGKAFPQMWQAYGLSPLWRARWV